ncbi:MAG: AAA family ATPase [Desulfobacterales bacterium]|nr:AAA family ATPase [Desulfobacterales bacterium]
MRTLAIYSNKGGVGKTATAVNLSYLAAQAGVKTLICDLDPQSSATYYFRIKPKLNYGAKGFIKGGEKINKAIKGTDYQNLDLLPADFTLRHLEAAFYKFKHPKERLKKIVKLFEAEYDLIIFDCPVTISILADNIFNASDFILVPLIPTTLSVRTYRQLLAFCRKNKYDTSKIYAFFSMVDKRKNMHNELMAMMVKEYYGVLRSLIPYLSQIERMGIDRQPVAASAPESVASKAYRNLWVKFQKAALANKSN